ncbi:MAG: glycosyltransferase family 4 protein [Sphingomonadales bacterium]
MKILYHHRTRSKDGQYVHIEELTNALKRRGHELIIVGPAAVERERFGAGAGLVATLKKYMPGAVYELIELAYSVHAYRRLKRALLKHEPDCLYERYNLFMPAGVWLKRRFHLPMLIEVNAPLAQERGRFDGLSLARLATWSEKFAWRGADLALPVTAVLGRYVNAAGVPEDRIRVMPNGINRAEFEAPGTGETAKARLGLDGQLVLGFTGFMRPWHGLDRVLEFIAASDPRPRLHFLAVGDGPAREGLEELAKALEITERVTFPGIVARTDIARYIAAFDIALQPDVAPYASPLKLFEYMAMERAILAPARDNIREVLVDGDNAVLFDPDTDGSFEQALGRLCADGALRTRLGASAGRAISENDYTWDGNARRIEALFKDLGVSD